MAENQVEDEKSKADKAAEEKAAKEQAKKDSDDVETYLSALRGEALLRGADGRFDHPAFNQAVPLDEHHDLDGNVVTKSGD